MKNLQFKLIVKSIDGERFEYSFQENVEKALSFRECMLEKSWIKGAGIGRLQRSSRALYVIYA